LAARAVGNRNDGRQAAIGKIGCLHGSVRRLQPLSKSEFERDEEGLQQRQVGSRQRAQQAVPQPLRTNSSIDWPEMRC
jgi:hypothetical protein